jgi:hypothetical protein
MSKFMLIVGILLAAIGVALGLMTIFSPGPMQVYGLTAEVAAILLVGGILSMGLGGLVDSRDRPLASTAEWPRTAPPAVETAAAAAVATATVAASAEEALSPAVSETIKALEKAKTDLQTAFEEKPAEPLSEAVASAEPEPEPAVEEAVEEPAEEEVSPDDNGQLYVLEERSIRGHAARLLSDGTVEAETSEGWMRFENLEHLDEYLDAMEPPRA